VRLDPGVLVADELERVVVDRAEVRRHHLVSGLADLEAEVEVIAVQLPERLVEADVPDYPRRQRDEEAVDGVDLAGARVRRHGIGVPRERREVPPAVLPVAVDE
jgi:hypothetical protein